MWQAYLFFCMDEIYPNLLVFPKTSKCGQVNESMLFLFPAVNIRKIKLLKNSDLLNY